MILMTLWMWTDFSSIGIRDVRLKIVLSIEKYHDTIQYHNIWIIIQMIMKCKEMPCLIVVFKK